MRISSGLLILLPILLVACNSEKEPVKDNFPLKLNELVSSNDGVNIDEEGQTEDWLELLNTSDEPVLLKNYSISDSSDEKVSLPDITLAPHAVILLWADDDAKDGPLHLPFKLSASGETLTVFDKDGVVVDHVVAPALGVNESYARFGSEKEFTVCRYATPNKTNGQRCEPPKVTSIEDKVQFDAFSLAQWPQLAPVALGVNEVALFSTPFIELRNFGDQVLVLSDFALIASAYGPSASAPAFDALNALSLPDVQLQPGDVFAIEISESFVSAIVAQPFNEGAITLFDVGSRQMVDFVPFMHWPIASNNNQVSLARQLIEPFQFHFCQQSSRESDNFCEPILHREVGNRLRGLYTAGDFSALAQGSGQANIESVKFVIDLENKEAVHFLGSKDWALHYTFVRQIVDGEPELNRCDSAENRAFNNGWYEFSVINYFSSEDRRFHLGTLSKHSSAQLNTVEFTFGDEIVSGQMKDAFYTATALTNSPYSWSLRPQDDPQVDKARIIEGELPIVSPKAPFKDITFQGLAPGVAYGTLKYVETQDLPNTALGNKVIVITNDVPNDIDFVAGLITEAFQTPLAHVNILSQSRNTPNMALPKASENPDFIKLLGKLVRLEVTAGGYTLVEAGAEEAQAFWALQETQTPVLIPRLDASTVGLVDLLDASFDALPAIGAKAAQMAELFKVNIYDTQCSEGGGFAYPVGAFAIPMQYYLNHFDESGASEYLSEQVADIRFNTDSAFRKNALFNLRALILGHSVDKGLMTLVESWVEARYGDGRVRFRSSSNTEDLSDFNGAGLYDSISGELGSSSRPIDIAIKTVWASLWNLRAYEEREHANVDQSAVAMGVLVHSAFTNERANGVGVGRNILDPTRIDQFYINSQAGEASVTNPAPGIVTEQLIYQWPPRTPTLSYQSNSSLLEGVVITANEVRALACALDAVQNHFRDIIDPNRDSRWFTMETEFKFLGKERQLLLKQARPYQFGRLDIPNDCREI